MKTKAENIDYADIGKRIYHKRREANLTQEQLGFASNLSISTINKIENGKTQVELSSLIKIANVLHVTMDELLCGSLESSEPVYQKEFGALLENCNAQEIRLLLEISTSVLQAFRSACKQTEF